MCRRCILKIRFEASIITRKALEHSDQQSRFNVGEIEWFHIYHMTMQGSHFGSNSTQLLHQGAPHIHVCVGLPGQIPWYSMTPYSCPAPHGPCEVGHLVRTFHCPHDTITFCSLVPATFPFFMHMETLDMAWYMVHVIQSGDIAWCLSQPAPIRGVSLFLF